MVKTNTRNSTYKAECVNITRRLSVAEANCYDFSWSIVQLETWTQYCYVTSKFSREYCNIQRHFIFKEHGTARAGTVQSRSNLTMI